MTSDNGWLKPVADNALLFAVIESPLLKGRRISAVIAALEAGSANAVIDEAFARDVEEGIKAHRELWNPPSWD